MASIIVFFIVQDGVFEYIKSESFLQSCIFIKSELFNTQNIAPNDLYEILKYVMRAIDFNDYKIIESIVPLDIPIEYKKMSSFKSQNDPYFLNFKEIWEYLMNLFLDSTEIFLLFF